MGLLFALSIPLRLRRRGRNRKYITMLRLSLFVFAGLVLYVNATSGPLRDCDGFSASKCTPSPDVVLDGPFPFPTENDCQDACRDVADCEFYSYNGTVVNPECYYYTADYRQDCSVYAGTRDAALDVCIRMVGFNHKCDEFLLNDCDYSGGILVEEARRGSIVDAYHCQDYCDLFESQGCDYWVLSLLTLHLLVPHVNCTHSTSVHQFANPIMDLLSLTMKMHAVYNLKLASFEK